MPTSPMTANKSCVFSTPIATSIAASGSVALLNLRSMSALWRLRMRTPVIALSGRTVSTRGKRFSTRILSPTQEPVRTCLARLVLSTALSTLSITLKQANASSTIAKNSVVSNLMVQASQVTMVADFKSYRQQQHPLPKRLQQHQELQHHQQQQQSLPQPLP